MDLDVAIDGDFVSIAPQDDPRVVSLCRNHKHLETYLGNFSDAFGQHLRPAVLLVRKGAPPSVFDMEALAGFRDAVALSVIPQSRARAIVRPNIGGITFSNAFWLYPWTLNRAYEDLIAATPALLGVHEVRQCRGQSSPELFPVKLAASGIDKPLLAALLKRWTRRYTGGRTPRADRTLFRSLNMANQASLIPAGSEATFYDLGRAVALWVSAFEILVHPGGKGRSDLPAVYRLLEAVPWVDKTLARRRYKTHETKRGVTVRRTLACWLYGRIYRARNDFLHGNPVTRKRLMLGTDKNLFQYTALVYRLALAAHLQLSWRKPAPPLRDTEGLGRYIAEKMQFESYQETIERIARR